jgi:hypothetical protein
MAGCEDTIDALLTALRRTDQLLLEKRGELRERDEWSEVSCDLTFVNHDSDESTEIWGYVDGELGGVGGVAWHLSLQREGVDWLVQRDMTLNAKDVPYQGQVVAAALPATTFTTSANLVTALPSLVTELLDLPAPRQGG